MDALDSKIITALQQDGRRPNTALARELGVTEATVRKRVERLRENGVIQVVAVADPLKIGYQTYADIQIQVRPPAIDAVAAQLAKFREIFFLGICTGTCDLLAGAIFRSTQHMDDFMTKRLSKVSGIERTMTLNFIRIVKRDFAYPWPRTMA